MKKVLLILLATLSLVACKKGANGPEGIPVILTLGVSGADTNVVVGSKLDLTAKLYQDQNLGDVRYSWSLNGASVSTTQSMSYSFDKAGLYELMLFAKNELGFTSKSVIVKVQEIVGGFYIVNEGWFGHENGSVNHFDGKEKLTPKVYAKYNNDLTLGTTTTFGVKHGANYYFVSKQDNRLVVADTLSWKNVGTLIETGGDGRAFAGVDDKIGVITTNNGAWAVNLAPLSIGTQLEGTANTQCGAVHATKDYLFVINSKTGILVYAIKDNFKLVKTIDKGSVGFAVKGDYLWAGAETELLKINAKSLDVEIVVLPADVKIGNSWGAWNKGGLCAAPNEDAIYFPKSGMWGGGNEIYKYVIGDESSLGNIFATGIADDSFYGAGISVDPISGDIVATFTKEYGYLDNRLVIFDAKTGAEKLRYKFEGYYFPSHILF